MTLTKLQIASASKETMAAALGSSLPAPADATTAATVAETATTTAAVVTTAVATTTITTVVAAATTTVATAVATAEAAATAVATTAATPVQDDPKDPVDDVITLALEGINLALSMDNPLGFPAMSPVSREPEIQGEPPQVFSVSSPLSQGEQYSIISLVAFP